MTLLLLLTATVAMAQEANVKGWLQDRDTREGVPFVTVQLLKTDSTFVTGGISSDNGEFALEGVEAGKYIVKFTSVGYKQLTRNITVEADKPTDMGTVEMGADAVMLKGATVTGQAAKVVLRGDTFQYNASAYRVPEGSTLEALVKKLPGAEVSDDGTIKINGKEVKKILVDGKEFMTGDTKTALKNLPTSIVERVKAYDQQSDLARVTGIDDGDEQTVLDFGIKRGMNKGLFGNVTASIGTRGRYSEKLMGAYFNDRLRLMLVGDANNVNDMGFGGGPRGGFGQRREGLNDSKMIGLNMNYDYGKLKMDGSLRWNHRNGDIYARSASENFVSTSGAFTNSLSQKYTRSNSWDFRYRLEWTPDSMTNIMFRPNAQITTSDGRSWSTQASFNEDPYKYDESPLEEAAIAKMNELGDIRFGQECRGIVAAQPQAKPERTQRDAARRNEPQGQQVYLAVVAGCASLPARQELSDKPLQPDAHQEPHLFGAGYLQRAYCEPHLLAVQLQIHLRLQQERPLNLRFLGPGRGIFLGHHSRVSRMEQLSVTAAAADRDL